MKHAIPTTSPADAVRVEVLSADEALAHLGDGTALAFLARRGDAPRVRDVEFGAWLGFRDPRQIRKLIKSMVRIGKFNGSEILHAPRRTPATPSTGRPADEVWLTREQALLVATQSGTPRAFAITRLMVRVFEAVLDATRSPALDGEAIAKLLREVLATEAARLRVEITAELRRELAANTVGDGVSLGSRTSRGRSCLRGASGRSARRWP